MIPLQGLGEDKNRIADGHRASSAPLLDTGQADRKTSVYNTSLIDERTLHADYSSSTLERSMRNKNKDDDGRFVLSGEHQIKSFAGRSMQVLSSDWQLGPGLTRQDFSQRDEGGEYTRITAVGIGLQKDAFDPMKHKRQLSGQELICGVDQFYSAEESVV